MEPFYAGVAEFMQMSVMICMPFIVLGLLVLVGLVIAGAIVHLVRDLSRSHEEDELGKGSKHDLF